MNQNNIYNELLEELKITIQKARLKAVLTVNKEMLMLYWQIGKHILAKQDEQGWGAKVIDNLAKDLSFTFPDMKGLSVRNLKYMRKFAEAYPDSAFVQAVPAQISWTHHISILDKISDSANRIWYILKSAEQGWSYRVLMHQIDLKVHNAFGVLPNNFEKFLPPLDSDLARQIFRDEYIFDFISQEEKRHETDLEKEFVQNITQFLLTLGKGFAFVGRQHHIEVGGQDFYIDLLFYHFKLKCFVVLELKIDDFKPEYIGKLNFYLSVVDDLVKQPEDKPSIGLLLCKNKNDTVVEYALRDMSKPMGVASYKLTKNIPDSLKDSLPTYEELEQIIKNKL